MSNVRILVAYATCERQAELSVEVPIGTTLHQCLALLAQSSVAVSGAENAHATGVWGKVRTANYVLREGDRLEIYRPLKADPKQARRARVSKTKRG